MQALRAVRGPQLIGRRLAGGRAVLGIGAGHQVLFERELADGVDESAGCGEWPGSVEPLTGLANGHVGWAPLLHRETSNILGGEATGPFFFDHGQRRRQWERR